MYLAHYGTKNMKWGVRKYQNEDGTLTAAGKERYRNMMPTSARKAQNEAQKQKNRKAPDPNRISTSDDFNKAQRDIVGLGVSVDTSTDGGRELALKGLAENAQQSFVKDIKDMDYHTASNLMDVKFENDKKDYGYTIAKALRQSRYDALTAQNERNYRLKNSANNMGKGSMPTSAISAKAKAENEAKVKANIPASAWNQRVSALNQTSKPNVSKEYKQEKAYNAGTRIPSASKADVNKKPNNASSEYLAEREYNSKKNQWK